MRKYLRYGVLARFWAMFLDAASGRRLYCDEGGTTFMLSLTIAVLPVPIGRLRSRNVFRLGAIHF